MAYDRYDSRQEPREPRSRQGRDESERLRERGQDRDDRGFFDRAGDEVASWFGDEEAERRRREDARFQGRDDDRFGSARQTDSSGNEEFSRYDRQPRFRDEGYRRPYTGRFSGRRSPGDDDRYRPMTGDYGRSEREQVEGSRGFTGAASTAGSLHDPHYSEWRRRQVEALDRDYEDYRRENQSRFESDFSNWRQTREGKRQMLSDIREQMIVVGSDEEQLGTVDKVRGDRIILTKSDSEDGQHHSLNCSLIDRVEGDRVIVSKPAAEARKHFSNENRDRALFERDDQREPGPHMLNRSFSGTY